MRIHSVIVDNFRAIEHLDTGELPERGVIIIHGDNEAGKSTILDAIDLVLRERSSSKKKEVKAVAPVGRDAGPEVCLEATVGETRFRIHKRWLKSPQAKLDVITPKPANYTGREAEDTLRDILAEHMDRELAQTLFLRQGQLDPGLQAAGIPSIAAALDAEAGTSAPGVEDTALMATVEQEYAKYWTAGAKPKQKATYAAKLTAVDAAREALERYSAEVDELSAFVTEVERHEGEIRQAESELPEAQREAETREREAAAAAKLGEEAAAGKERLAQATVALERAEEDLARRGGLAERAEAVAAEAEALRAKVDPAREAAEAEGRRYAELATGRDEAKRRLTAARAAAKRAVAVRDLAQARERLKARDELIARVDEADRAYAELLDAAPQREATDADVRAIEDAATEVTLQRRLLEAAAAKLDITASAAEVTVDGEPMLIDGTCSLGVFDGTEVVLGDFRVVYRAAQGAADPREAAEAAEQALAEALDAVGCESADEARDVRDACAEHAGKLAVAKQRRDDLLAGSDRETLARERDGYERFVSELLEAVGAPEGAGGGVDEHVADRGEGQAAAENAQAAVADTEAKLAEAKRAEAELAEAEQQLDTAEAALKPYADRKATSELTVLETRLEAKLAEAAAARTELDAAEAKTPRGELKASLEAARVAVAEAKAAYDDLAARSAAADPETAELLAAGARNRVASLQQRKSQAATRNSELRGRIEIAAGAAERKDRAEAELTAAEEELRRVSRRANAAKLLRDTMTRHRDAARARYTAPFNDALRSYARVLYGPTVDFSFGDALDISQRTVGDTTVALSELSGGTKEQLAILARFAIADLVTGGGDEGPAPVVVDDALGATDPERLSRMNLLFDQVGAKTQVLVLTCFPQRFDRVNAARRYSMAELKAPQPR